MKFKHIFSTTLLTAMTTLASASVLASEPQSEQLRLSSADSSAYTQLCMASLESKSALRNKARELGISSEARNKIECNDFTLGDFAANYSAQIDVSSIATVE